MQDLGDGAFHKFHADDKDERRNDEPGKVLDAVVAERMLVVGGLGRHFEADQRHDGA